MKKTKDEKKGSPIFIFVIFTALIIFLFVLPDLYSKYNNDFKNVLGIEQNKPDNKEPEKPEIDEISDFYQIKENKKFKYNEIEITDILLKENTLTLEIKTNDIINLEEKNYYIEFYENKSKYLGRRILKNTVNKITLINIDIKDLPVDTETYISISHISDEAIPKKDYSSIKTVLCEKKDISLAYELNDSKLVKVTLKETIVNPKDEYVKFNYQKKANQYNDISGVTASIVDGENGFIFLSEFDYLKTKDLSEVNEEHLFKKDEGANIIVYKMNAEGFECK